MSGATFTLSELAGKVTGGNLAAMTKMLNAAGIRPALDENEPDPGAVVDRETVIDLLAMLAGDVRSRSLMAVLAQVKGDGRTPAPGTTETMITDAAALQDRAAWERANRAKLLTVEILPDGKARAEVLRVGDVRWCISVRNCRGVLMLTDDGENYTPAGALFDLDAAALGALIVQVVEQDFHSTLDQSGTYFPLTKESRAAFMLLMATARRKS